MGLGARSLMCVVQGDEWIQLVRCWLGRFDVYKAPKHLRNCCHSSVKSAGSLYNWPLQSTELDGPGVRITCCESVNGIEVSSAHLLEVTSRKCS